MMNNDEPDREILKFLLDSKAFYTGTPKPKKRTGKISAELRGDGGGSRFSFGNFAGRHASIGFDIGGGGTTELISVSIIAEIQSVIKNRAGRQQRRSPVDCACRK